MATEIITKADLEEFRLKLLNDIRLIVDINKNDLQPPDKWLRSHEVRSLLKISTGTLQNLVNSNKLHCVKIGGLNYYERKEISGLLNGNSDQKKPLCKRVSSLAIE